MNITEKNASGKIIEAATDDGRIVYNTFCDGPVIDGRPCWRGGYIGDDGRVSGERVEASVWGQACELMGAVRDHNAGVEAGHRDRRDAAYADRMDHVARMSASVCGFEDHPDNN